MRNDIILGKLPDPFIFRDGGRAVTKEDWERRRTEILEDAVGLEYGGMPPKPEEFWVEPLDLHGRGSTCSYRVHLTLNGREFTFCFMTYVPKEGDKFPVLISGDSMYNTCNDEVIAEAKRRGYVVAKFNRTEFAPDYNDPDRKLGIYSYYPGLRFTAISAWAWGYSRVIDALLTLDYIDGENIAVSGHSRGGKTTMLAGATDERIRFVNPNDSGTHGCAPYRFIQMEEEGAYQDQHSERLDFMIKVIPYWMGDGLTDYIGREQELPHDSHFFKALIAPRCLIETNGYGDIWANPRGSYLSWQAAREAWKLYGAEDCCRTWYREGGHGHGIKDFTALFDFMDHFIKGTPLPEEITRDPYDDMEPLYDWKAGE